MSSNVLKSTSMDRSMKKCPFCGEEIKAEALKCRFCGEMLDCSSASGVRVSPRCEPCPAGENPKSKAMKLATYGSTLSLMGLLLSPLFAVPGVILGFMAFKSRTESEKQGWGGKTVNNKALTAVIAGILSTMIWIIWVL